jgi:hypothetical protein
MAAMGIGKQTLATLASLASGSRSNTRVMISAGSPPVTPTSALRSRDLAAE